MSQFFVISYNCGHALKSCDRKRKTHLGKSQKPETKIRDQEKNSVGISESQWAKFHYLR